MACSSRQRLQLSIAVHTEIHAVTRDKLCLARQPESNSRIWYSRSMKPDFPSETTTLFVSTYLACLRQVTIDLLTCCRFCIAILVESIPFYLFLTHRLPGVFVLVASTCIHFPRPRHHLQSTQARSQQFTELEFKPDTSLLFYINRGFTGVSINYPDHGLAPALLSSATPVGRQRLISTNSRQHRQAVFPNSPPAYRFLRHGDESSASRKCVQNGGTTESGS